MTWRRTKGIIKNKIDYIITNKRASCKEVTAQTNLTSTLITRTATIIDTRRKRNKFVTNPPRPTTEALQRNSKIFQTIRNNKLSSEEDQDQIVINEPTEYINNSM